MILGVSSYITSAGLKAITSAGALGPYFAIKYFLPIYDFRIDKTICRGTSGTTQALSISGLNLVSATDSTLVGERLFYNGSYSLTSANNSIYYDANLTGIVQGGTSTVLGSRQSVSTTVNTISAGPISPIVSGSSVLAPNPGTFYITNTSSVPAASFNPISGTTPPISAYYRVQSYSPKQTGITSASGTYKCRIPSSGNGTFKFNGLAIYATKVNETGFDDNGYGVSNYNFKPVLFAVVLFDQAQTKQDKAGGVNDFEINVDLGFDWSTLNTSGAAPVYIETNYWSKMPTASTTSAYGISYDGDVVIASSAVPGSWTPRAKLTVTDKNKEQLRLANDDDRFVDFRSYRFGYDNTSASLNTSDKTVLDIDTSCPDDSLLQLGLNATALGIKSVAIGCYSSAVGYLDNGLTKPNAPTGDYAGGYTTSIGINTLAGGFGSFAVGDSTSAYGRTNFAGGKESVATCHNGLSTSNNEQFWDNKDSIGADCNIAYGYMTSAISRSKSDTPYTYNVEDMSTLDDSCGGNVAFGVQTFAGGGGSVATGLSATANGIVSVSMGLLSKSMGIGSTSFGLRSHALGNFSLAHGCDVVAGGGSNGAYDSTSVGQYSYALALGEYVSATNFHSIAIGRNVKSTAMGSIAIGTAMGTGSFVESWSSPTVATGMGSVSIGAASSATGYNSYAIGGASDDGDVGPRATGDFSFALGTDSISTNYLSFAFGAKVSATGSNSVAFGNKSGATGSNAYAFGNSLNANGSNSFAFGNSVAVNGSNSFGLGNSMTINGDNSYGFGSSFSIGGDYSYGIGQYLDVGGTYAWAIGNSLTVNGTNSIVIGDSINVDSTSDHVIAIGKELSIPNGTKNSIFIGSCSSEKTAIAGTNVTIGGSCTDTITLDSKYLTFTGATLEAPKCSMYYYNYMHRGSVTREITFATYDSTVKGWKQVIKIRLDNQNVYSLASTFGTMINESTANTVDRRVWFTPSGTVIITNAGSQPSSTRIGDYTWYLIADGFGNSLTGDKLHLYDIFEQLYAYYGRESQPRDSGGDGNIDLFTYGTVLNKYGSYGNAQLSKGIRSKLVAEMTYTNYESNQAKTRLSLNGSNILAPDARNSIQSTTGTIINDTVTLGNFV